MPPPDERFDSHDRAGPQIDLGQIVQQQRVVVDFAPGGEVDVVGESRCSDMSSLETATWLPPARLAARTASSARCRRSLVLSRPGMPTATPTLTVRLIM